MSEKYKVIATFADGRQSTTIRSGHDALQQEIEHYTGAEDCVMVQVYQQNWICIEDHVRNGWTKSEI